LEWYGTKYYMRPLCVPITSVPTHESPGEINSVITGLISPNHVLAPLNFQWAWEYGSIIVTKSNGYTETCMF